MSAHQVGLYILPEYRELASKFIRWSDEQLSADYIVRNDCKGNMGDMLTRLGYLDSELIYRKRVVR